MGVSLAGPLRFSIQKGFMNNCVNSENRTDRMLKIWDMIKYLIQPSCFLTYT